MSRGNPGWTTRLLIALQKMRRLEQRAESAKRDGMLISRIEVAIKYLGERLRRAHWGRAKTSHQRRKNGGS